MVYKKIRLQCLSLWIKQTKRRRHTNDVTLDTLECEWQNKYVSKGKHNSFYCSVAEWNTHITDLLKDTYFDKYDFNTKSHRTALFRHYTRIFLIVSEILTDFQDFFKLLEGIDQNQSRIGLTDPSKPFTFQQLFDFINAICKHKIGQNSFNKYHFYNHHIDYYFLDSGFTLPINIIGVTNVKTIKVTGKEKLEIPSLFNIVDQVLFSYKVIDQSLKIHYKKQRKLLKTFERKL